MVLAVNKLKCISGHRMYENTHIKEVGAGYSKNFKIPIIRGFKCIKVRILTGKPSVGCRVDQHHNFPLIFGEGNVP